MAINPQINDMAWFGKPADPVGSFQKGMNLAEQKQRMSQSADMHPLKMADLQSATAARDANTNLSKQSYRFNELTEADRASNVKSQARRNAVVASVAEKTQQAQIDMTNLRASEAQRNWDARQGVDMAIETQAIQAELERAITNQAVNRGTQQSQIDRYKLQTDQIGANLISQQYRNDLTAATFETQVAASNGRNLVMIDAAQRAKKQHQEWLNGYPAYKEGVSRIEDAVSRGDYQALRNMTFANTTSDQTKQLNALIAEKLNNDAGQRAQIAAVASQTELTNTTGKLPTLTDDQREGLEKAGGFDPKTGALTATGQKQANRMAKQNELFDGLNISRAEQRELIMQAAQADTEDEVAMFTTGLDKPFSTDSVNLSNRKVSTYGSKVGDTFVLNGDGLENLEKLVAEKKKAAAAADRAAKIGQAQDFGMIPTNVKIDEKGNMTYELTQNALSQKEQIDSINSIAKNIQDNRKENMLEPLSPAELYKQALQAHGIANVKIAGDGDDVRRLGLGEGDRFFNYDKGVFQRIQSGKAVSEVGSTQEVQQPATSTGPDSHTPPDSSFTPEQRQYNDVAANKDMIGGDLKAMGASPELSQWMIKTAAAPNAGVNYSSNMSTDRLIAGLRAKADTQIKANANRVYNTLFDNPSGAARLELGIPNEDVFSSRENEHINEVYDQLSPYFGKSPAEYPENYALFDSVFPLNRSPQNIQMLESRLKWWKGWSNKDSEMSRIGMEPADESGRDSRYQNPSYSDPETMPSTRDSSYTREHPFDEKERIAADKAAAALARRRAPAERRLQAARAKLDQLRQDAFKKGGGKFMESQAIKNAQRSVQQIEAQLQKIK